MEHRLDLFPVFAALWFGAVSAASTPVLAVPRCAGNETDCSAEASYDEQSLLQRRADSKTEVILDPQHGLTITAPEYKDWTQFRNVVFIAVYTEDGHKSDSSGTLFLHYTKPEASDFDFVTTSKHVIVGLCGEQTQPLPAPIKRCSLTVEHWATIAPRSSIVGGVKLAWLSAESDGLALLLIPAIDRKTLASNIMVGSTIISTYDPQPQGLAAAPYPNVMIAGFGLDVIYPEDGIRFGAGFVGPGAYESPGVPKFFPTDDFYPGDWVVTMYETHSLFAFGDSGGPVYWFSNTCVNDKGQPCKTAQLGAIRTGNTFFDIDRCIKVPGNMKCKVTGEKKPLYGLNLNSRSDCQRIANAWVGHNLPDYIRLRRDGTNKALFIEVTDDGYGSVCLTSQLEKADDWTGTLYATNYRHEKVWSPFLNTKQNLRCRTGVVSSFLAEEAQRALKPWGIHYEKYKGDGIPYWQVQQPEQH